MLRYTPRVPNQKLSIFHWFPITEEAKSGFRRVKDGGVNDPPTVVQQERTRTGIVRDRPCRRLRCQWRITNVTLLQPANLGSEYSML